MGSFDESDRTDAHPGQQLGGDSFEGGIVETSPVPGGRIQIEPG